MFSKIPQVEIKYLDTTKFLRNLLNAIGEGEKANI